MRAEGARVVRTERLHLAPWASLRDRVFMRLPTDEITGRGIPLHLGTITSFGSSRNRNSESSE